MVHAGGAGLGAVHAAELVDVAAAAALDDAREGPLADAPGLALLLCAPVAARVGAAAVPAEGGGHLVHVDAVRAVRAVPRAAPAGRVAADLGLGLQELPGGEQAHLVLVGADLRDLRGSDEQP